MRSQLRRSTEHHLFLKKKMVLGKDKTEVYVLKSGQLTGDSKWRITWILKFVAQAEAGIHNEASTLKDVQVEIKFLATDQQSREFADGILYRIRGHSLHFIKEESFQAE